MDPNDDRSALVLTEIRDADGLQRRSVHLSVDGRLRIEGHDIGAGVERALGSREFEFERSLSATETARLAQLLGVEVDGLLAAVKAAFDSTHALEQYLEEHAIAGEFWSRIGD